MYRQQTVFNTGASGKVTGTTRLKVRVGIPAASRLDESSGKAVTPRSREYGDVTATYIRRSEVPSRIYAKHQYKQESEYDKA